MKLNRRYGLNAPGYRRQYTTEVVFAIDSSGSMSDEDLAEGFAVVNSGCRHAKVHYILFDTEITMEETNVRKAKRTFKVTGRGGTNFQKVIDYADKMKADGLIIYTDGCAPAPSKPNHSRKVLWLMSKKEQKPPVDWGYVTHLNRFESHV
jgi:predicted metal-dependent peptidase